MVIQISSDSGTEILVGDASIQSYENLRRLIYDKTQLLNYI